MVSMPDENSKVERQFDLLFGNLREIQQGLVDAGAKVAGFLLLATGWIATSNEARTFLHEQKFARYVTAVALAGAFIFYLSASVGAFVLSQRTFRSLKSLDFMPQDYYSSRRITLAVLLTVLFGNVFLAIMAIGLVLHL
jgi:hypothetical protein